VPNEPKTDDAEVLGRIISSMKRLDADARRRVYQTIGTFFQLDAAPSRPTFAQDPVGVDFGTANSSRTEPSFSADRAPKPKHFLSEKQPRTDVERVACLAFYLTHYRDMPEFTTLDISKLNTEAAQRKLSNATAAVNNASQYGYLVPAGKGQNRLARRENAMFKPFRTTKLRRKQWLRRVRVGGPRVMPRKSLEDYRTGR